MGCIGADNWAASPPRRVFRRPALCERCARSVRSALFCVVTSGAKIGSPTVAGGTVRRLGRLSPTRLGLGREGTEYLKVIALDLR